MRDCRAFICVAMLGLGCNGAGEGAGETSTESGEVESGSGESSPDESSSTQTDESESETGPGGPFMLGGRLIGLQGQTLTLDDGAGHSLVLEADGTFDFPVALEAGTEFSVSVSAQPAGPDQGCVVDAGVGTIDAAVDTILVRCVTPIRHLVILGIDGLGGDFVEAPPSPHLDELIAESSWTLEMRNAIPTWSATNWMSMINGSSPDQHGVMDNNWEPGDSEPAPTLFARVRAAHPEAKIGVFHDWADFGMLVEPGVADVIEHSGDEFETMNAATTWAIAEQPELLFIHLDHVDHAGHFNGWASGPYDAAVSQADELLGQLRTALEATQMWPYTALIISADHGGVSLFHGTDTPPERPIPFIVHTPQGPRIRVDREIRIWDIAASAAWLLDVEPDPQWVGRPVFEAIEDPELMTGTVSEPPDNRVVFLATNAYTKLYDDTGTLAFADVSFWRPDAYVGYASFGDVAVDGHGAPNLNTFLVETTHPAVVMPIAYEKIWSDAGAGGDMQVTLWNPLPPAGRYVCPGQVAKPDHAGPPALDQVRCIHENYLQPTAVEFTWDDTGSGAAWDVSVWSCRPGAGSNLVHPSFSSRRHHDGPGYPECFGLREVLATPPD